MDLKGKQVLVFGTGISGIAAAKLLTDHGALIVLYDSNPNRDMNKIRRENIGLAEVSMICGDLPETIIENLDLIVVSPGVPLDLPIIKQFQDKKIPIWGEIELAYQIGKGQVVAITGTNGKTTTTSLVGEIMKNYFSSVFVVGNIGIPYTQMADETKEESVIVAEISSFQLETIDQFRPRVSAILNITEDHLDRHHTMEGYQKAKENIAKNQSKDDVCVLNYEDQELRRFGETLDVNVIYFSSSRPLKDGFYYQNKELFFAKEGEVRKIIAVDELQILGLHNYENALAACAMCYAMGVPFSVIEEGLRGFWAVEHRIEYVCTKKGIRFYNDSKGTNPDAAIKGIQAMDAPTVLIGGGYDKHADYSQWIMSFQGKVKELILLGQTKQAIAECAKEHGFVDVTFVESLEEAVNRSYQVAQPGECVLLSPACASWGMFDNYQQRGNMFKEYVNGLKE